MSQEPNSLIASLCAPAGIGKRLGFEVVKGSFKTGAGVCTFELTEVTSMCT